MTKKQVEHDSRGQKYVDVRTARITYVRADQRAPEKNWPGMDVIRVQAYADGKGGKLYPGAEIPLESPNDAFELLMALCQLFRAEAKGL